MNFGNLESNLLEKLNKGLLDGVIGSDYKSRSERCISYRNVIEDGIPKSIKLKTDVAFFDSVDNVLVSSVESVISFETDDEKLTFIQKYGWLMDDPDAQFYSSFFKPKKTMEKRRKRYWS